MSQDQAMPQTGNIDNNKPSILIADDSRVVRVALRNILERDFNIIEANNGNVAWKILIQNPEANLIFSDLAMPELDGIGLLRKLRESSDKKLRELPFIVITGKEETQEIRSQLMQEGANALVSKPFVTQDIIEFAKKYAEKGSYTENDSRDHEGFLSGITNKVAFSQEARKELSFAIRNKNELALLLFRFDQFEKIKQHYSEPAIEHILISTGEIIRSQTRIDDKIAYFGAGTYAILLPASNAVGAKYLGRRILSDLQAKKFYLGESDNTVTASIGLSAPEIKPGITFSDLLFVAEQRLEAAINAGGNRVVDKGNATVTPISTLLSDFPETDSDEREILRQTEISMRQLAEQEVQKIKTTQNQCEDNGSISVDVNEINDSLLLAEQENRLLKEEIFRLQKENQQIELLKQQLHETDALQQQTLLNYQQMEKKFEAMRIRAENAEVNSSHLDQNDDDRSFIEEHLLEESKQLQSELNQANQKIQTTLKAYKKAEAELSNIKERTIRERNEYEIQLADEQMLRSIAEKKLAEIVKKFEANKKDDSTLTFTATPSISPVEKKTEIGLAPTMVQSARPMPYVKATNEKIIKREKVERTKRRSVTQTIKSWSIKILASIIIGLLGIAGFMVWSESKTDNKRVEQTLIQPKPSAISSNNASITIKNGVISAAETPPVSHSTVTSDGTSQITTSHKTSSNEKLKQQTELILRQKAEEEFKLLKHKNKS